MRNYGLLRLDQCGLSPLDLQITVFGNLVNLEVELHHESVKLLKNAHSHWNLCEILFRLTFLVFFVIGLLEDCQLTTI